MYAKELLGEELFTKVRCLSAPIFKQLDIVATQLHHRDNKVGTLGDDAYEQLDKCWMLLTDEQRKPFFEDAAHILIGIYGVIH